MIEFYKIKSRFGEFSNYKINRKGEILCWNYRRSDITGIIKPYIHTDGYLQVKLVDDNGISHSIKVHTLVADTFIPNPNDYTDINHKDEDKTNNSVENLEWCSRKENLYDSYSTLSQIRNFKECLLVNSETKEIIGDFKSISAAAKYASENFGCSKSGMIRNYKSQGYEIKFNEV